MKIRQSGIIVCNEKDRTIVESALKESKKPIAVAQYKIKKKLPKDLKKNNYHHPSRYNNLLKMYEKLNILSFNEILGGTQGDIQE